MLDKKVMDELLKRQYLYTGADEKEFRKRISMGGYYFGRDPITDNFITPAWNQVRFAIGLGMRERIFDGEPKPLLLAVRILPYIGSINQELKYENGSYGLLSCMKFTIDKRISAGDITVVSSLDDLAFVCQDLDQTLANYFIRKLIQ